MFLTQRSGVLVALPVWYDRCAMSILPFHPIIADWFTTRFARATDVQMQAWPAIRGGRDVLIAAPTGSGPRHEFHRR